ncbi:MAG: hypothetical protein ACQEV7_08820 [Bacillota bacterium]
MKKAVLFNGILISSLVGALITKLRSDNKAQAAIKIKGNQNSRGELIYHVPEGQFYEVTKAIEWFDSEEAAVAAGYRKSAR